MLASIVCDKGDTSSNLARHSQVLDQAASEGCELAVFPEFSLTGAVNPRQHPDHTIKLDNRAVKQLIDASARAGVAVVFGLAERRGNEFFITQAYAAGGHLVGVQRKRHLGEGEEGFSVGVDTAIFDYGAARFGLIICAESGVDFTWDRSAPAGEVMRSLPDWKPDTLIVDIPIDTRVEPVRWAIRVMIVDDAGRALLVQFSDDLSGQRWWVPPGGGIEPGKDDLTCAQRELSEELGRDDLKVGPLIGHRGHRSC